MPSLEEIRGLLGTLPGPPRIPADVAGRIDAALAAEAVLTAMAPESADAHVSRETSASGDRPAEGADHHPADHPADDPANRSTDRLTDRLTDRPAGRTHAATGPGRKERRRGGRRRTVVLGAVLTAAVLGAGSLLLSSFGNDTQDTTAHGEPSSSAHTFSGSALKSQVTDLLATKKGTPRDSGGEKSHLGIEPETNTPSSTASAHTFLQTSVPVPECVREGINSNDVVLGAKKGTYDGKKAYLVVLPDTADTTRVTAYVVDAACESKQPVSPGTVLLKQSFARS